MVDQNQDWREYQSDLSMEEIKGLEEIEMGLARLFITSPDQLQRGRNTVRGIAADCAEYNRVMASKPADEPVPAGATAGPWEWSQSWRGWSRELTWMEWHDDTSGLFVRVGGNQDESRKYRRFIYVHDYRELPQPTSEQARAMAEALLTAADLIEAEPITS